MDAALVGVMSALLHACAMMFFPIIMGLSTSLCLRSDPSPFSIVSVSEYVGLTLWLDRLWLLGLFGWTAIAVARLSEVEGDADPVLLTGAVLVIAVCLAAAHLWFQSVLATELAEAAVEEVADGPLTTIDDDGICIAERREYDGEMQFVSADLGVKIYLTAALAATAVFVVATTSGVVGSAPQCLLLAGFYVSLGVILVDLFEDVYPGFTTPERVERASRYYVQIFEQWRNHGVLLGFLTVLIGAPVVYSRGEAPVLVMSFLIWIGSCLCFATFFNQVLYPRGMVSTTLPLPVWVNVYSVTNPLWANFFAVIHLVMAACLIVGIGVVL